MCLCLNRLNIFELCHMKQHPCISIFRPTFLTSKLEIKQKHLAGKLLRVVRIQFHKYCRNLQSNCKEVKAYGFKKISSIVKYSSTVCTSHFSHFTLGFLHVYHFPHIQLSGPELEQNHVNGFKRDPNLVSKYPSAT